MQRTLLIAALLALASSLPNKALAQAPLPADVINPASDDGIPTLLAPEVLNLPDVQFRFDGLLDPERISAIQQVTRANMDDPRLTAAAQSIINNHLVAMQQVELALQFLLSNRDDILAGNNTEFNSIFGNPGELREMAVVNPTPLSGLARVTFNAMTGGVVLDFQDNTMPNLPGQIKPGDFVFVGDAVLGDPLGFIVEVDEVLFDDDGSNQMINGTSTFGGSTVTTNRGNVPVHRIVKFEQRTDSTRFERVVETFAAIKAALSGTDANLPQALQTTNPITYQRSFMDINQVWGPGVAPFMPLDQVVQRELGLYGATSTATADRLIRQAGFSNSDSYDHIVDLRTSGGRVGAGLGLGANPRTPLLWTEDNNLPRDFLGRSIGNTGDETRAFFRDRQTIFGTPDDPTIQYIGRAFLEEVIVHDAGFFDNQIAVAENAMPQTFTTVTTLANGQSVTFTQTLFDPLQLLQTTSQQILQQPESGTPIVDRTELRKWQMIIESFAEHSQDLTLFNVAAVGVTAMFGEFAPDDLKTQDAGSYAKFAALIGSASSLSGIDPGRIEPFGKRGSAGFNPVVPRN